MTVDGCMQAEATCGQSLVKIMSRLTEGELTVSELAGVLAPAFRGGGNNVDQAKMARMIYEAGLCEGIRVCAEVLTNVLTAGRQEDLDDEELEKNVPEAAE